MTMSSFKYLLLFTLPLVYSVDINCKYYGYAWDKDTLYTCSASLEDVVRPGVNVTAVIGEHTGSQTNLNVEAVGIHGQKTFYIIQGLLEYFPNMKDLYVFRSDLRNISQNDFKGYTQLTTISLSRNRLTSVPNDAFNYLHNLEKLSLSFNALTSVPNLKALKKLKELYLFENSIESLSATDFERNVELEVIWLYHNKIRYIDSTVIFDNLPNLMLVDLKSNRCIDMQYRGRRDAARFIEVIKQKCQSEDLSKNLSNF